MLSRHDPVMRLDPIHCQALPRVDREHTEQYCCMIQLSPRFAIRYPERDEPCAGPVIRVHGSYCSSSPVRYALYSGLFSDGSSHGVSASARSKAFTHCQQGGYIVQRPFPICLLVRLHILFQQDHRAGLSVSPTAPPDQVGMGKGTHLWSNIWQAPAPSAQETTLALMSKYCT